MVLFEIHQRFKCHFLNELRVSFTVTASFLNSYLQTERWQFRQTFTCSKTEIEKHCSKLTLRTPERRHWFHSGVFIVNSEHVFLPFSSTFIVEFKQLNVCRELFRVRRYVKGYRQTLSNTRKLLKLKMVSSWCLYW